MIQTELSIRNLFTGGSRFDVVGVLGLGASGLRVASGTAEERPDDAAEVLRDSALPHQLLDVAVPLLVAGLPLGYQTAPQTPLVLLAVARIAGSRHAHLLFAFARSCSFIEFD